MRRSTRLALVLLLTASLPPAALAGGLEIPDNGAQALSRGGAFVAKADDPTAIEYNPAGLAEVRGTHLLLSANLDFYSQSFTRSGVYQKPETCKTGCTPPGWVGQPFPTVSDSDNFFPAPFLAFSTDMGGLVPGLTLVGGLFGPSAIGKKQFPQTVTTANGATGAPAPQRYDLISENLLVVFPTLGVAYRINHWVDVGAEFQSVYTNAEFVLDAQSLATPPQTEDPADDALTDVKVSNAFRPTAILSALVHALPQLSIGASARLPVSIDANGTATVTPGAHLQALKGNVMPDPAPAIVSMSLPLILRLGARWAFGEPGDDLGDVELDGTWEQSSKLHAITTTVNATAGGFALFPTPIYHDWKDTYSVRLGGSYRVWQGSSFHVLASAGTFYSSAAAPDAYTRLDFDAFQQIGLTAGVALATPRLRVQLGFADILEPTRTVSNSNVVPANPTNPAPDPPTDPTQWPIVGNGTYAQSLYVAMVSVEGAFGH